MTIYTEACVRSQFSGCCDYKAYGILVYLRVKGNHYAALTNSFSYLFYRFKLPEQNTGGCLSSPKCYPCASVYISNSLKVYGITILDGMNKQILLCRHSPPKQLLDIKLSQ